MAIPSKHLEMILDHDTGTIDGRILTGPRAGQVLSALPLKELLGYYGEIQTDEESLKLFETFLDRVHPDWRGQHEERGGTGDETSPASRNLSQVEAYELLGLEEGCSEEDIRTAYRRLIKRVHPDSGGSAALMAQVTQARDQLLRASE